MGPKVVGCRISGDGNDIVYVDPGDDKMWDEAASPAEIEVCELENSLRRFVRRARNALEDERAPASGLRSIKGQCQPGEIQQAGPAILCPLLQ